MLLFLSRLEVRLRVRRIWRLTPSRMSLGVEEILLMDGAWLEKQDEFDGSINCKQSIDGLLMKKGVSQKQKQVVHSVEPGITPASGMSALNGCAGWNELLVMADQGKVVSSCGTPTMRISISR